MIDPDDYPILSNCSFTCQHDRFSLIITISLVTTFLVTLPSVQNTLSLAQSNSSNITNDETKKINHEGVALFDLGKYIEAISSYDKALAINPNDTALDNKQAALNALSKEK
jgi:tetratricopeptide (TPR) repeat protein